MTDSMRQPPSMSHHRRALLLGVLHAAVALLVVPAAAQSTRLVSVDSGGLQGNKMSWQPSISSDGRFVAFESRATNLVPGGDTNGDYDVLVHDRQSGSTMRVSVDSGGVQGNSTSWRPSISSDGRFVAFESSATNLVPGDTNGNPDVFVHDRQTGLTTRVSVASGGLQGNSASWRPSSSSDGRFVAFASNSSNLVPGDSNGKKDVFVHDRQSSLTTRVSVDSGGLEGNDDAYWATISSDGRFVAFYSDASNLVPGDTSGFEDVFVHDRQTGLTTRVSMNAGGLQGNDHSREPTLSADGRFVAFKSDATNLVPGDTNGFEDVFVHDRRTGLTTRVSVDAGGLQGNAWSDLPSISSGGRFVAFRSDASNLVPGDTNGTWDAFVHDRLTGETTRVSVDSGGAQGNLESYASSISADGRFIAFGSAATNLVPGDANGTIDVFVRDRGPGSGASEDSIVLAVGLDFAVHEDARISWFAAPQDARYWLLTSAQNSGMILGGHPFGLGPGFRVVDMGKISTRGTGVHSTAPFPAWTQGRTVFIEVAARDAGGRIYDSNTVERTVQ